MLFLNPDYSNYIYLNRMIRREYLSLFMDYGFDNLSDKSLVGRLSEQYLNNNLNSSLACNDQYKLFSNRQPFVLREQ